MTDAGIPAVRGDRPGFPGAVRSPWKVHLLGGEGAGWALDQDRDLTRRALQSVPAAVELVPLDEAEVVHAVWDASLDSLGPDVLAGRIVVCHVCTNVYKMMEQAATPGRRAKVDLWVTQTGEATEAASRLGWPHFYVPYAFDTDLFAAAGGAPPAPAETRRGLGIRDDAFLVGNFMRDSLGANLDQPKPEKGADLFLEVVSGLKDKGVPVHVLLAGPRRHWLRRRLAERGVPMTFLGTVVAGDDVGVNILPLSTIASLYRVLDLYLVTSRHEGGPRAVLEAAASRTPILSTPVGLARDVLQPSFLYRAVDEGVDKALHMARRRRDAAVLDSHFLAATGNHAVAAVARRFEQMYRDLAEKPPSPATRREPTRNEPAASPRGLRWNQRLRGCIARLRRRPLPGLGLRICLWHEFHKPPYGGGNQFMLALQRALSALGADVVNNRLDDSVDVHICNAVWFGPGLIEGLAAGRRCRIIHRLDGLVHIARGNADRSIDDKAYAFNRRYAAATVMQSEWCLKQAIATGYDPVRPVIIRNASDPRIFFPAARARHTGRVRIVATSWSDNPQKGAWLYKALEAKLDWSRFDFTFVGRTPERFDRIRVVPPQSSGRLAALLREHDLYITASRNEACSNALIEALSCGLPALYLNDSGNPEVVGYGGLPFDGESDVVDQLLRLARSREAFRRCIRVDTLRDVALRYLELARELVRMPEL